MLGAVTAALAADGDAASGDAAWVEEAARSTGDVCHATLMCQGYRHHSTELLRTTNDLSAGDYMSQVPDCC